MIFHKTWFSKHQNKAKFKNLDDSRVLSSNAPGLRISAASMTSTDSVASMTSTASFHKKKYRRRDGQLFATHSFTYSTANGIRE
jgi:hypothetical protein